MKKIFSWKLQLLSALAVLAFAISAHADGKPGWVCGPDGCIAAISATTYAGFDAWRLCDGKTEAIVVPAIGRVMSFKTETGDNWLWNAAMPKDAGKDAVVDATQWRNWGGDKTWLAPQSNWRNLGVDKGWPPPPEWEGAFQSEVISGGKLKMWGAVSPSTGLRVSRVFYHADNGDFIIEQTVQQEKGTPLEAGIWSVTQINGEKMDAIFLARGEKSDYEPGYRLLSLKLNGVAPQSVTPTVLKVTPTLEGDYKIGTDTPVAAIAAVKDGWAFVQRSARPEGKYPDGEEGKNGTPVQLFSTGNPKANYLEMELLSPIYQFKPGKRWKHTVHWSLKALPGKNVDDEKSQAAVGKLLN